MKIIKYLNIFKFKYNDPKLRIYFLFAFIRILLVFIPQFGYIHPDEFFQSVEVMAGIYIFLIVSFNQKNHFHPKLY